MWGWGTWCHLTGFVGVEPELNSSTPLSNHQAMEEKVELFVMGLVGKPTIVKVGISTSVRAVKQLIESQAFIHVSDQRLLYRGRDLTDDHPLSLLGFRDCCTIYLTCRLLGGAPHKPMAGEKQQRTQAV